MLKFNSFPLNLSCISLCFLLFSCGGGGDSDPVDVTNKEQPLSSSDKILLSGKVIDGYVSGATVWLDINGDGVFDSISEPSTVSGESGDYALEFTDEQAQCQPYSTLYVDVPVGAIDEDLGEVLEAYQLAFPPSFKVLSNDDILNISPLTTYLWQTLKQSLEASRDELISCDLLKSDIALRESIEAEVKDVIRGIVEFYNISEEQIYADFIETGDIEAHDIAQNIVSGLKAAYAHKKALQNQYPEAEGISVYVYKNVDSEFWQRNSIVSYEHQDIQEVVELSDDLTTIENTLYKMDQVGTTWGTSFNGWLNFRKDISYQADGSFGCLFIETLEFDDGDSHFEITNHSPDKNTNTVEECETLDFTDSELKGYAYRYIEGETHYGAGFEIVPENTEFSVLSHWVNFKGNSEQFSSEELIDYLKTLPFRFDDEVTLDVNRWHKSKSINGVTIQKIYDGTWTRETENSDGTRTHECSSDGDTWILCSE